MEAHKLVWLAHMLFLQVVTVTEEDNGDLCGHLNNRAWAITTGIEQLSLYDYLYHRGG